MLSPEISVTLNYIWCLPFTFPIFYRAIYPHDTLVTYPSVVDLEIRENIYTL